MKALLLRRAKLDEGKWLSLLEEQEHTAIFAHLPFIDAVAPECQFAVIEQNEQYVGGLPVFQKRRLLLPYALQPVFLKYWGPFYSKDYVEDAQSALQKTLPFLAVHQFSTSPGIEIATEFLSSYRRLELRTYRASLDDSFWDRPSSSTKRQAKKAIKMGLSCEITKVPGSLESILSLNQEAGRQLVEQRFLPSLWRLLEEAKQQESLMISSILNEKEIIAEAAFLLDRKGLYYLIGAVKPEYRNSGAMSLLFKEVMNKGSHLNLDYLDFLGSTIPGIEKFFKGFGATPIPYFSLTKKRVPFI